MAGVKLIELAQPPPCRFQDSGQTKDFSRLHDSDGGSRHATNRAVAATAHRAHQIMHQVSRACRQASVQSASLLSPRQPEPFLTCGLDTAEPHMRAVGVKSYSAAVWKFRLISSLIFAEARCKPWRG